jgi:hypothetical protein
MDTLKRRLASRSLLALLICLALLIGPTTGGEPAAIAKGAPLTLYLAESMATPTFVPLDPMTLVDTTGIPALSFEGAYPAWTISADGSTLAAVEYSEVAAPVVRIEDAASRAVRTSFIVSRDLYWPQLTRDGALLVMQAGQSGGVTGVSRPEWTVFSTADGSVVATITGDGQGTNPFSFHEPIFDPIGERLYLPFVAGDHIADGPLPLQIAQYDLRTGLEIGRIELPNVLAGSWFPPETGGLGVVNAVLSPGIALSPNDQYLAVVDAATGRVTIIHAASMQIAREFVPKQPVSRLERLLAWLSLSPRSADAKLMEGTVLGATYGADGNSLLITGRSVEVGQTMQDINAHGLGIERINIVPGEIEARALDGVDLTQLWATPDGGALYALGYDQPWETTNGVVNPVLRRLDPQTLEVQAERELSPDSWVTAVPMATT